MTLTRSGSARAPQPPLRQLPSGEPRELSNACEQLVQGSDVHKNPQLRRAEVVAIPQSAADLQHASDARLGESLLLRRTTAVGPPGGGGYKLACNRA